MTAQTCPHCCAPVRGGGRPACLCAAAGADDFDPLRIRPYVSLPDEDGEADNDGGDGDGAGGTGIGTGRGDLLDLPGVDAAVHLADGPPSATGPPLAPGPPVAGPAEPLAPRTWRRPGPASRTFRASEEPTEKPATGRSPTPLRRKRALPAVLLTAGAAVAATAVLIGTDALSDGPRPRAAAPGRGTVSPSAALPTGGASAPAPSGTASPTATRSPSPDAAAPEATVRHHRTPAPRPPAPTRASLESRTHEPQP